MVKKLKSSSLNEFSSKMVRYQDLPFGTEFRLYRTNSGQRVRSDITIKRKGVNPKNISKLDGTWNVKDLIEKVVDFLSTDITARKFEMQLFAPDSTRINGNTLLANVRKLEPKIDEKNNDKNTMKILSLLEAVLGNSGIEDVTLTELTQVYNRLNGVMNNTLGSSLLKNEKNILSDDL